MSPQIFVKKMRNKIEEIEGDIGDELQHVGPHSKVRKIDIVMEALDDLSDAVNPTTREFEKLAYDTHMNTILKHLNELNRDARNVNVGNNPVGVEGQTDITTFFDKNEAFGFASVLRQSGFNVEVKETSIRLWTVYWWR